MREAETVSEKGELEKEWDDKKNIRNVLGIFLMPFNKKKV
jgi:hypothetical protein